MKVTIPLFVYGTLKRGFRLNRVLTSQEFLGEYYTKGTLVNLGRFPGLVLGGDKLIQGELYSITGDVLVSTDYIEGEGHFYKRQQVDVYDKDGNSIKAWVYEIMDPKGYPVLEATTWEKEHEITNNYVPSQG